LERLSLFKKPGHIKLRPTDFRIIFMDYLEVLLIVVIMALGFKAFFAQIFKVPTESMENTILKNDYILCSKIFYGPSLPFTYSHLPALKDFKLKDMVFFGRKMTVCVSPA
jgi:signal peptidase I